MTRVDTIIEPDADTLAATVADQLESALAALQSQGRVPSIVLTGGSIAERVHRAVAERAAEGRVDWSAVEIWWGDERYVAADDPDRNEGQARRAFLDVVGVDESRVHPMPADDGTPLVDAAAAFDDVVCDATFDIVMLGVGPDGHIASLFPGRPTLDLTDRAVVAEDDSPKPPPQRLSLTFPLLNRGREVWFLVTGGAKAPAVAAALSGSPVARTPAAGVRGIEHTLWMLDEAAAADLTAEQRRDQ